MRLNSLITDLETPTNKTRAAKRLSSGMAINNPQ